MVAEGERLESMVALMRSSPRAIIPATRFSGLSDRVDRRPLGLAASLMGSAAADEQIINLLILFRELIFSAAHVVPQQAISGIKD